MIPRKSILLFIALLAIAGTIYYLESLKPKRVALPQSVEVTPAVSAMDTKEIEKKSKQYPLAKEITAPAGFINTQPFKIADFIGKKVILLDFWTYSCINCQRTLPYITTWWNKYKDDGLLVIGIHTPEFDFEKKLENVKSATQKFGITYPVVLDNDYGTWTSYENRYWPRKYLIDIDGFIVYDHIGEGGYDVTEKKIQELLQEHNTRLGEQRAVPTDMAHPDVQGPTQGVELSPEIYFGSARNLYLGNGASQKSGMQTLQEPTGFKTNILYLAGDWNFINEYAENKSEQAKIIFRYQAKNVFFVANSETGATIRVLQDGKPLGAEAGADVAKDGSSTAHIKEPRLYKLIQDSTYGEHTIEIIIEKPGLNAFTFTFG